MAETPIFFDPKTGIIKTVEIPAVSTDAANFTNIASLIGDARAAVKILAAADTSKAFKITEVSFTTIGGTFTTAYVAGLIQDVSDVGMVFRKYEVVSRHQAFNDVDKIFQAGTEIWATIGTLPVAGATVNCNINLCQFPA